MADESVMLKSFMVGLGFKVGEDSFKKFANSLTGAQKMVAGTAAAILGAGIAVAKFGRTMAEHFEDEGKLSARVGLSVKQLEKMHYVAKGFGVEASSVDSALKSVNDLLFGASHGFKRSEMMAKRLGLELHNQNGTLKTTSQLFTDIQGMVQRMPSSQRGAFLERLGIDPSMVRPMIEDTKEAKEQFEKLFGGIDYEGAAKSAVKFNEAWDTVKSTIDQLSISLGAKILPTLAKIADAVKDIFLGKNETANAYFAIIKKNFDNFVTAMRPAIDGIRSLVAKFHELDLQSNGGLSKFFNFLISSLLLINKISFEIFGKWIQFLAWIYGQALEGINVVIKGTQGWIKYFEIIKVFFVNLFKSISEGIDIIFKKLGVFWGLLKDVGGFFKNAKMNISASMDGNKKSAILGMPTSHEISSMSNKSQQNNFNQNFNITASGVDPNKLADTVGAATKRANSDITRNGQILAY